MKNNSVIHKINNSALEIISRKDRSLNPIVAIIGAIGIAILISLINLVLFIRSDMYEKVRLIQNPEQILSSDSEIDLSSPLKPGDIKDIKAKIDNQLKALNDDKDYPESDVSESSLGI